MKPSYLTGRISEAGGFKKGGRVTKTFRYADGGAAGDTQVNIADTAGKTIGDIFGGALPGWIGDSGIDRSAAATPENIALASNYLQVKTPAEGSPLQSGGPEGGFFPGEGTMQGVPLTAYGGGYGGGIPEISRQGQGGWSTNNWRLLPQGFNQPGYIMRNGNILNTRSPGFSRGAPGWWGGAASMSDYGGAFQRRGPEGGRAQRFPIVAETGGYYWPGQMNEFGRYGIPTGEFSKRGGRIKKGLPSIKR